MKSIGKMMMTMMMTMMTKAKISLFPFHLSVS